MKRTVSILLSVILVLSLVLGVGCSSGADNNGDVVVYSEKEYPALNKHNAFLSVDENGNLQPDGALTVGALVSALNAVNSGDGYFQPQTDAVTPVNYDQLRTVLGRMYDSSVVSAVFVGSDSVTRAEFAVGMCTLLGRGSQEKVKYESLELPKDINFNTENLSCLLEATVPHTVADDGRPWTEAELPTNMKQGFNISDGWLYYVKEDGQLLRNGSLGRLQFGSDGRYTSGDSELDATVAEIIRGFVEADPNATRFELLREAFDYSYEEFSYGNRYSDDGNHNIYDLGHTGWEIKDAKNMFRLKQGNCYCFAAVFWALARGLGYEARAVAGTCLQDFQPHGWVIIEMDGEDYIFDPEWQWAYINEHKKFDKDMFKIPLDKATWWNYRWDKTQ
ncbi:MAG: transglutaminase domain-containing protein [Ruminococcaceae bacterium]|nr:transglutaminase domain-containing protein [Oscillospiraceae bacterium]